MDKLNIDKNKISSYSLIYLIDKNSRVKYWLVGIIAFLIILMFLPWTQNIKAKGSVTTLYQEERLQELNTPIAGKIIQWKVKEGDLVKKGDTILQLSEIKADYLDPQLINRTQEQIAAKKQSITYYEGKVVTAEKQIGALESAKSLKIEQLKNKQQQLQNKLVADKAELAAAENDLTMAKDQFERQQKMYDQGLVSQTQLQQRNIAYQNALAKKIAAENKVAITAQDITNNKIEQNGVEQEYLEKVNKTESDKLGSLGEIAGGRGDVAKLENMASNYIIRNGMYYIIAPQDGQIVQANKSGIGEIMKEGEKIASIVPTGGNYSVEAYVRPVDLPLISKGQKVRLMFDGFPAIVFSGWPNSSYGTFGGEVIAYENAISNNGMFRILIAPDKSDRPWPPQIKIGTGANTISLLKDVPIWYELWRNINGFPPDFYQAANEKTTKKK